MNEYRPLDKAFKQAVENVCSKAHQFDVRWRAIHALAIHDWSFKHVTELRLCAQVVRSNEVHHAPVLEQIVLQRVTGQHHTSPSNRTEWMVRHAEKSFMHEFI